ncbi:MAG: DNA topoisomerase (ATP-hydrolyzing) subunit B [Candidatus Wildermuthbacteria bacterium]|nr:DNA topoisomerase (ATP-hydrolyzing) subunit B [Candidatus Wildermuthbacteria bacterium]
MTDKENKSAEYGAKDIMVLEGLDPVRKRPAMYIGSTGPDGLHHLIWEVLDNSIDEALGGFAKNIEVSLLPQNRVRVVDDGRGIPVEKHPQTKKSTLETVMTILHAGGKFGGKAYQVSGGLHGVGVSVVNALSTYLRADVRRENTQYYQEYAKGNPKSDVKKAGKAAGTGTSIIFEPDIEIFKEIKFDAKRIISHLRQQAYLTSGVKLTFIDAREEDKMACAFYFEAGIASYIPYLTKGREGQQSSVFYVKGEKEGIIVETAFLYTEDFETFEESFANNIHTPEGGTHLTGFRSALTRTLNDYAKKNNFLKGEEALTGEDVREGITAVVSIKIREPQFEGQTKTKLGNQEAKTAVEAVVAEALTDYLERNPQDGRAIIEKCLLASKARKAAKAARQTVLRKGILEGLALPGKLADCSSKDPEESELYIVEGDSAGGSAKQARDRRFQAILPLRGKILNVERARLDRLLDSKEIRALVIALGTAIAEDFDIAKLRYHRIIIMTDADVDGSHIRALLLTLFYRYFKSIIEQGYIYIAQPPLYRVGQGKSFAYAFSDSERDAIVTELKSKKAEKAAKIKIQRKTAATEQEDQGKETEGEEKISGLNIQRYKGLGEMNADQLWETTMNPARRILLKVNIQDAHEADTVFDVLMGDEVAPRKKFIQTYAKSVRNLDI